MNEIKTNIQFNYPPITPYHFADPIRHSDAIQESLEPIKVSAENQSFSALHLNRDFSRSPLIVRVGSWKADVTQASQKYTGYQIAAAYPENPVLLVDLPGHGHSDPFTKPQKQEIFRTQKVSEIGSALAEGLDNYIESSEIDTPKVIFIADSLGARVQLDVAKRAGELGVKVLATIGFETVGLDKKPSIETANAYLAHHKNALGYYTKNEDDLQLAKAYLDFKQELQDDYNYDANSTKNVHRDSFLRLLSFMRSPVSSDTGYDAIDQLLDSNAETRLHLISGNCSHVSRWEEIQQPLGKLIIKYSDRMSWLLWFNGTHAMSIAPQQPRLVNHTQAIIASLGTSGYNKQ